MDAPTHVLRAAVQRLPRLSMNALIAFMEVVAPCCVTARVTTFKSPFIALIEQKRNTADGNKRKTARRCVEAGPVWKPQGPPRWNW
jgi:hypothetical protein